MKRTFNPHTTSKRIIFRRVLQWSQKSLGMRVCIVKNGCPKLSALPFASPELELPGTLCLYDHEHARLAKEKSSDDSVLLGLAGGGGQFYLS